MTVVKSIIFSVNLSWFVIVARTKNHDDMKTVDAIVERIFKFFKINYMASSAKSSLYSPKRS